MKSIELLRIPENFRFYLVVIDNNPESQYDKYIGSLMKGLPFEAFYGHEPKPGYSSARNKAIELALKTDSEIFAFVDDDLELEPDWIEGQLASYAEFRPDAVLGNIAGKKMKSHHGELRSKCGMGNTSFRRHWVSVDGFGLRFDPKFDKTGGEDWAFTELAVRKKQIIVFSDYPVVVDHTFFNENDWLDELENRAKIAAASIRNRVVDCRQNKGIISAIIFAISCTRYLLKLPSLYIKAIFFAFRKRPREAVTAKVNAKEQVSKTIEAFKGLWGDVVERQELRRSK